MNTPSITTENTPSHNSYPVLSTKEKIINAIPLVLVTIAVAYFAYSCQQNRKMTNQTANFVQQFQAVNVGFDKELDLCLHQKLSSEDFRKKVEEKHLPNFHKLLEQSKKLPEESSSFIVAFPQIIKVIELKIQLSEIILDRSPQKNSDPLVEILEEINNLQKTIYFKAEKVKK